MLRITLPLLLFLVIPDLYIYFVHIVPKISHRLLRAAYWLPTLLLGGTFLGLLCLSGENAMAHHTQFIGWLAILLILFITPKIVFMLCSLTGVLVHGAIRRCPRKPFNVIGITAGTAIFCCIAYGTFIGITRFEVKEVEIRSPKIPEAFDGYRIVQLSDIHIGSWQGKTKAVERLVDIANGQQADLIVFTGDLVNQRSHEVDGFQSILSRLKAPDGVYSVLGNHDYGDYYRWSSPEKKQEDFFYLLEQQQQMGWKLLNNAHVRLCHGNDSIALIGVENDGEPPFSQHADLRRAMQGTDGMFKILLSHNPTHWRREVLPYSDIDLMLAGHTHAMQGILFGRSLAELKYPEWQGMYREGNRMLYVNIGIGYVGLPFRFGAWPEITVFTLRHAI